MDIQVDVSRLYTCNDVVSGKVVISPHVRRYEAMLIELKGVQSRRKAAGKPDLEYSKVLYRKRVIKWFEQEAWAKQAFYPREIDFSLQIPDWHDIGYGGIPASFVDEAHLHRVEIHHIITVLVLRWHLFVCEWTMQQSIELQFMPNANIETLRQPNVVYREQLLGNRLFMANISMPRFFAQGHACNRIKLEFLKLERKDFQIGNKKMHLIMHDYVKFKSFAYKSRDRALECPSNSSDSFVSLAEENSCEFVCSTLNNLSPPYSLPNAGLSYSFKVSMTIKEIKTGECHEVSFSMPIAILPTLIKKPSGEYATSAEIMEISGARKVGLPMSEITRVLS